MATPDNTPLSTGRSAATPPPLPSRLTDLVVGTGAQNVQSTSRSRIMIDWIQSYAQRLIVESDPPFQPGEINNDFAIRGIASIAGTPIAEINRSAQPNSYTTSEFANDVIEQMVKDNQTVEKLGTSHKQIGELLLCALLKSDLTTGQARFSANDMDFQLTIRQSEVSQSSPFSHEEQDNWNVEYDLANLTQKTSARFTAGTVGEILALGFYGSPVAGGVENRYAVDPSHIWRMLTGTVSSD